MTDRDLEATVAIWTEAGLLEVCNDDGCDGGQEEELFDETTRKVFARFTEQLTNGEPMSFDPRIQVDSAENSVSAALPKCTSHK